MKSPYSLILMICGVAAITATPFQSALALNATEVSAIAEAVTVRIDGQNSGSGVIIKHQANIYTVLTAAHVVGTEDGYDVVTPDGQRHELEYSKVKKLPNVDLALVEFTSFNAYTVAEMGDSTAVKAGESIYVSGFPNPTAAITESIWNFSDGRVKANAKRPLADGYALVYSNDTLPGMSGGAVLNSQGNLIAIHGRADAEQTVQKTETVYQKTGFNLGIPINTFLNLAANVSPNLGFIGKVTEVTGTALTADDWLLQAGDKHKKGNLQDAIKDLDQAIALNPKYTDAYNNRGTIYLELKQYPQAIKDLDQAIALSPQYAKPYNNRGNAYSEIQQYAQAIQDLDQAIAINPKFAEAYHNRGTIYLEIQQYAQAIQDLDQAIALKPKFATAYTNRGNAYSGLKQYSQAIKDLDQAIAINPKNVEAYINRGFVYNILKQYPQAIKNLDQAIALNPKFVGAYNNRGFTHLELKQYSQALKDFDQAIALNPKFARAYYHRGRTYNAMGNKVRAAKDFHEAAQLSQQQNNPELYQKATQLLQGL